MAITSTMATIGLYLHPRSHWKMFGNRASHHCCCNPFTLETHNLYVPSSWGLCLFYWEALREVFEMRTLPPFHWDLSMTYWLSPNLIIDLVVFYGAPPWPGSPPWCKPPLPLSLEAPPSTMFSSFPYFRTLICTEYCANDSQACLCWIE